ALHLTRLHGQVDLVAAWLAVHGLALGAERAVEYFGELVGIRGCPGTADDEVLLHDLLKLGDPGRVPGDTNADLVIHAAEPIELGGVELGLGRAEQWIE